MENCFLSPPLPPGEGGNGQRRKRKKKANWPIFEGRRTLMALSSFLLSSYLPLLGVGLAGRRVKYMTSSLTLLPPLFHYVRLL